MPRYVAFLRGINVGGHRVKMDHLRGLLEEASLADVATFIASGNVVFSADSEDRSALENGIEEHLAAALGYQVPTFVRSLADVESVASFQPFTEAETSRPDYSVCVVFLSASLDPESVAELMDLSNEADDFQIEGREIYWLCRGKLTESPAFDGGLDKVMRKVPTTMRNVKTLRRLVAKFTEG